MSIVTEYICVYIHTHTHSHVSPIDCFSEEPWLYVYLDVLHIKCEPLNALNDTDESIHFYVDFGKTLLHLCGIAEPIHVSSIRSFTVLLCLHVNLIWACPLAKNFISTQHPLSPWVTLKCQGKPEHSHPPSACTCRVHHTIIKTSSALCCNTLIQV